MVVYINKKDVKMKMIKDVMKKKGCSKLWWKIQGYSMWPFLCPKDQVLLTQGVNEKEIKIGDIVLYENGEYFILHRVINFQDKYTSKNFLLKGDFLINNNEIIQAEEIIAKLSLLKKTKLIINMETPKMRKINFILAKISLTLSSFFSFFPSYIPLLKYGYQFIWCLIGCGILVYIYMCHHSCLIFGDKKL